MTKVISFVPKDNINAKSHRKENHLICSYTLFNIDTRKEVCNVRVYWPGTVCYACLWVFGEQRATGSDKAGGYGYDKREAAVKGAFESAGFKFEDPYEHHDPHDILEAVAKFLEIENFHIFTAHG